MTEYNWIEVSKPDGTLYEVGLRQDSAPIVLVHKTRRDTGVDYTQTIKPGSANWRWAYKAALTIHFPA